MSIFMRLFRLIAPYKWWILLGVLLTFVTLGAGVGLMAMSAYLIARASLVTNVADIALVISSVRLLAIVRVVFRYLERYFTHTATFRIMSHLRVWFFAAVEPLAPAGLQQYQSGDLLTRVTGDIETLENFYVRVIIPPAAAALVTLVACAILGAFSLTLAVALLAFLLLTGLVLPLVTRRLSQEPAAATIAARSTLNAQLVDHLQGMADLLVFDEASAHRSRLLDASESLARSQERLAVLRGASSGLAALFTSLAGLTVLLLAIPLVTSGQIEGVYLALIPLAAIASFEAVQPLSLALQQLEANLSVGRRVFELIDQPPPVADPPDPAPPPSATDIVFDAVHFRYQPDAPEVLDGFSLTVPHGGRVGITGPSGCGKSTLVNLLARFWDVNAGAVRIGGCDVRALRQEDLRALIGVVSQDVHLFNATLRDNLLLANADATDDEMLDACRVAQLADFIAALPAGLNTLVGENGMLLSGGERQRLAVARAVLKGAPVLVLDEATANLDPITEAALMDSLEPFMNVRTVIIIAHGRRPVIGVDRLIDMQAPLSQR